MTVDGNQAEVTFEAADVLIRVALRRPHALSPWLVRESGFTWLRDDGEINAQMIRGLHLGDYLARAKEAATNASSKSTRQGRLLRPSDIDLLEAFATRGPKSDRDYAQLALRYVLLVQAGDSKPAETIAAETGHGTSARVWANRIGEARNKRRLLTAVKQGQSGGELTPKALNLLGLE